MFERFTDQARQVVTLAQEEARMLDHDYVGTEHLLLSLIQADDGMAARALASLGISLTAVRQQVEEIMGQGKKSAPDAHLPFTPRAKKVLEFSLREALQLGHNYIGTEHILLGLIREGQGIAARVLVKLGADLSRVRQEVIMLVAEASREEDQPQTERGARRVRLARGPDSGRLAEAITRIESMDSRLSAIEQRVGTGPAIAELDQQITQLRRDREAAAGTEDYESAAALRDRERQLLAERSARQDEWATAQQDLPALTREIRRLSDEVDRLRGLLGERDIGPRDGAA
jgi:ATP-dependent Clp protease ATP-binding subunit ClpC